MFNRLRTQLQRFDGFLRRDIWFLDMAALPRLKRFGFSSLRVGHIVTTDVRRDQCGQQAAALTFITLMSMVPLLAMGFAMAKGLGAEAWLRRLVEVSQGRLPEQVHDFIMRTMDLVENTSFLALGVIGLVILVWSVIEVMSRIESSFNTIWGVKDSRPWARKVADYTSIVVLVPILAILALALNGFLASDRVTELLTGYLGWGMLLYRLVMRSMGLIGISGAFVLLYMVMPNTKVKLGPALAGGITAGVAWVVWQWICISFQVGITKYNTIYGAFATLPITLFWLNTSWLITLLGAELCYAVQNQNAYVVEENPALLTFASRRRLAYFLVYDIAKRFRDGTGPWRLTDYRENRNAPIRLLQDVLHDLETGGILLRSQDEGWVPARALSRIRLADIELAMEGKPDPVVVRLAQRVDQRLTELLDDLESRVEERCGKTTLDELLTAHQEVPKARK